MLAHKLGYEEFVEMFSIAPTAVAKKTMLTQTTKLVKMKRIIKTMMKMCKMG